MVYSKARLAALAARLEKLSVRILLFRSSIIQAVCIPVLRYVASPTVDVQTLGP